MCRPLPKGSQSLETAAFASFGAPLFRNLPHPERGRDVGLAESGFALSALGVFCALSPITDPNLLPLQQDERLLLVVNDFRQCLEMRIPPSWILNEAKAKLLG